MKIEIIPSALSGTVKAPPSKSAAHRLLICAALADGESVIKNVALSNDVSATLDCLSALGAKCDVIGDAVRVRGVSAPTKIQGAALDCRESGSTLRFMIPLCLLSGQEFSLSGSKRLLERPLDAYEKLCAERGLGFENDGARVKVRGVLPPMEYVIDGSVSSQFISGLLFALPTLSGDSKIVIAGGVESRPYIDMTLDALGRAGVKAEWTAENEISIPGGQKYSPFEATVEGDCSNAAFFEALDLIGGDVKVTSLDKNTRQGDKIYGEYFKLLSGGAPTLSLGDCPDLGPIAFAVAAEKNGATFTGTRRLRIKESDRVASMTAELKKFGASLEISTDSVKINKSALHAPEKTLSSHNDHRVAMALAVLMTKYGGTLSGAEAVAKSMPDFFEKLSSLGAKVKKYED
ncbi:MAG: 3-phosphoshikimate 1-carboxyvinyltransferase [Clostridia bacterium]|nr:3-phosphoshikimate 1-carboxyvinyltransferase [Clostridia bacterium]